MNDSKHWELEDLPADLQANLAIIAVFQERDALLEQRDSVVKIARGRREARDALEAGLRDLVADAAVVYNQVHQNTVTEKGLEHLQRSIEAGRKLVYGNGERCWSCGKLNANHVAEVDADEEFGHFCDHTCAASFEDFRRNEIAKG